MAMLKVQRFQVYVDIGRHGEREVFAVGITDMGRMELDQEVYYAYEIVNGDAI